MTLIGLLGAVRPAHWRGSTFAPLLGAEVNVQIVASTREQAEQAEQDVLSEIARLSALLCPASPDSEWRRWLACPGAERVPLSLDLTAVLRLTDQWRVRSGGALHPGAGAYGPLWTQAARLGRDPDPEQVQRLSSALRAAPWTLHADGTATLHAQEPLSLDALAQGYVVDRAAALASRGSGVRSVTIQAGSGLRLMGRADHTAVVADPFTARDNAPPLAQVRLRGGALATRVPQPGAPALLDPRTGWPLAHVLGVTVQAPDRVTADALATVLSVQGVAAGLPCVDSQPGCAALMVTEDGRCHTSRRWRPLERGRSGWQRG